MNTDKKQEQPEEHQEAGEEPRSAAERAKSGLQAENALLHHALSTLEMQYARKQAHPDPHEDHETSGSARSVSAPVQPAPQRGPSSAKAKRPGPKKSKKRSVNSKVKSKQDSHHAEDALEDDLVRDFNTLRAQHGLITGSREDLFGSSQDSLPSATLDKIGQVVGEGEYYSTTGSEGGASTGSGGDDHRLTLEEVRLLHAAHLEELATATTLASRLFEARDALQREHDAKTAQIELKRAEYEESVASVKKRIKRIRAEVVEKGGAAEKEGRAKAKQSRAGPGSPTPSKPLRKSSGGSSRLPKGKSEKGVRRSSGSHKKQAQSKKEDKN